MRAMIVALLGAACGAAAADQAAETEEYVKALQGGQLADLAVDYLRQLEVRPDTPPKLKASLGFDIAAALMDLAESADPETEAKAHDEATTRFRKHLAGKPDVATGLEARNHLAYILLKRGQRAAALAEAATDAAKQKVFRDEAKKHFDAARKEFAETVAECRRAVKAPGASGRLKDALLQARMNQAMVEYQSARAFDAKAKERTAALIQAEKLFGEVAYDAGKESVTFASIYAKLFQGKALSDAGKHRDAIDLLEEVVVNERLATGRMPPAFRALLTRSRLALYQAFNGFKKPERVALEPTYNVATWLKENPGPARSADGMGVQLEAAKAYLELGLKLKEADKERARLLGLAAQRLNAVARSSSPYAREAFRLRDANAKHLKAGAAAAAPATFEEALEAAAALRDNNRHEDAAEAYGQALALASKADPEKIAEAQFGVVLAQYRSSKHAEAAAMAETLFKERPSAKKAPLAVELGLDSRYRLYRAATGAARAGLAEQALAFASAVEARYPDLAVADGAKRTRGYLLMGARKFPEAATAFAAVKRDALPYGEAQLRYAQCKLVEYETALRGKPADGGKALADDILKALGASSAAQRADLAKPAADGKAPDPKKVELPALLVEAETLHAETLLRTGQAKAASAVADPLVPAVVAGRKELEPFVGRVLVAALDAASAQKDFAKADALVEKLVQTPSDAPARVTNVLVRLGQGLEKTWKDHLAGGREAEAENARGLLKRFLDRFVERPQQDYRGARHVAESYGMIGQHEAAAGAYEKALALLEKGPPEVPAANRPLELSFMKFKQAEAYRKAGEPHKAKPLLDALIEEAVAAKRGFPLKQKMELARTLQLWGESDPAKVAAAMTEWNQIHNALGARRGAKTEDYFEARLGIGWCFWKQGKPADGVKYLKATMALNPGVGGPAMEARYQDLIKKIAP